MQVPTIVIAWETTIDHEEDTIEYRSRYGICDMAIVQQRNERQKCVWAVIERETQNDFHFNANGSSENGPEELKRICEIIAMTLHELRNNG